MGCNQSKQEIDTPTNCTTTVTERIQTAENTVYKILLLGDTSTGKSSTILRFDQNKFTDGYSPTLGVDFCIKTIELNGKKIKLQIWDTAGQERFRTITSSYYRGANGVMIFYDITNQESFNSVNKWLTDVKNMAGLNISKLIIGNKCDLEESRVVNFEVAKKYADEQNISIMEVSAKESFGVEEAFIGLTSEMLKRWAPVPVSVDIILKPVCM
ncbi:hypothetical protein ACTA71_012044 [Dictyostelium dimigraforme]